MMSRTLEMRDSPPYQHADDWNERDDLTYPPETEEQAAEHPESILDVAAILALVRPSSSTVAIDEWSSSKR